MIRFFAYRYLHNSTCLLFGHDNDFKIQEQQITQPNERKKHGMNKKGKMN